MKVHPAPKKRNITFGYNATPGLSSVLGRQKKLRRLPHIFSKVLELPFVSDADVVVQEDVAGFQFFVATDDVGDDVRAHMVEIHPGVMKIVIRDGHDDLELDLDDLELDRWRFRLPPSTRPELATAVYAGGELIVTVPKAAVSDPSFEDGGGEGEVWGEGNGDLTAGGIGRLLVVQ